jgi:hypothetical protein
MPNFFLNPQTMLKMGQKRSKMCSKAKITKNLQKISEKREKGIIRCYSMPSPLYHGTMNSFDLKTVPFVFQVPTF